MNENPLAIVDAISAEIHEGTIRDRARERKIDYEITIRLAIVISHHLDKWPKDFKARGRGFHPRRIIENPTVNSALWLNNISYEMMYRSSKNHASTYSAIVPEEFWQAVRKECSDLLLFCPAGE